MNTKHAVGLLAVATTLGMASTARAMIQNPGTFTITFADFDTLIGYPKNMGGIWGPIARVCDPNNAVTFTVDIRASGSFDIPATDFPGEVIDNTVDTTQIYHVTGGTGLVNANGFLTMILTGYVEYAGHDTFGNAIPRNCQLSGEFDLTISTANIWGGFAGNPGSSIDPTTGVFTAETAAGATLFPDVDVNLCTPLIATNLKLILNVPNNGVGNGGAYFQFGTIDPIPY
jgi:hypothetical protein